FVLNVGTTFDWQERKDLRVRLAVSAGFFDYSVGRIDQLKVPDDIGTLTIIPGLEKVYQYKPDWELIPHIDWGVSQNFATGEQAQVYSLGLHSRKYYPAPLADHVWVNKI